MRVPGYLLRDRVTIAAYSGQTGVGPTYDPPKSGIKAHVEHTDRLAIDREGNTLRAEAVVILRPEDGPVPVESKLTWSGKVFRVLSAGGLPDEVRPTHRELLIG